MFFFTSKTLKIARSEDFLLNMDISTFSYKIAQDAQLDVVENLLFTGWVFHFKIGTDVFNFISKVNKQTTAQAPTLGVLCYNLMSTLKSASQVK